MIRVTIHRTKNTKHSWIIQEDPTPGTYASLLLLKEEYYKFDPPKWLVDKNKRISICYFNIDFLRQAERHGPLTCRYCGAKPLWVKPPESPRKPNATMATVDHIVPTSKGGLPFHPDNLCVCCNSCNQLKADHSEEEFKIILRQRKNKLKKRKIRR